MINSDKLYFKGTDVNFISWFDCFTRFGADTVFFQASLQDT